jgi:hypothetical protein
MLASAYQRAQRSRLRPTKHQGWGAKRAIGLGHCSTSAEQMMVA